MSNFSIGNIFNYSISFIREPFSQFFNTRQKQVVALTLAIFGCLTTSYYVHRCFTNKKVVPLDPLKKEKVIDLFNKAVALKQQNPAEALKLFGQALDIESENISILTQYADSLLKQGKYSEAKIHFEKALNIDPNNALALSGYADTLRMLDKFDEAKAQFENALTIDPNNAFALRRYAETLRQLGL